MLAKMEASHNEYESAKMQKLEDSLVAKDFSSDYSAVTEQIEDTSPLGADYSATTELN
jgi:hypothetical protein